MSFRCGKDSCSYRCLHKQDAINHYLECHGGTQVKPKLGRPPGTPGIEEVRLGAPTKCLDPACDFIAPGGSNELAQHYLDHLDHLPVGGGSHNVGGVPHIEGPEIPTTKPGIDPRSIRGKARLCHGVWTNGPCLRCLGGLRRADVEWPRHGPVRRRRETVIRSARLT